MDNKTLTNVALRYRAVFLDINREDINMRSEASAPVIAFTRRLKENGYCVTEELLHALNAVPADRLAEITECINDVMGVKLNWASLVKGWNVPTGESLADHLITLIANIFGKEAGFKGTTLPCGHLIPEGTFPLERYNGCPFCGTPEEVCSEGCFREITRALAVSKIANQCTAIDRSRFGVRCKEHQPRVLHIQRESDFICLNRLF